MMTSSSCSSTNCTQAHVMTVAAETDERLEGLVQKFWNIDSIDNDPFQRTCIIRRFDLYCMFTMENRQGYIFIQFSFV